LHFKTPLGPSSMATERAHEATVGSAQQEFSLRLFCLVWHHSCQRIPYSQILRLRWPKTSKPSLRARYCHNTRDRKCHWSGLSIKWWSFVISPTQHRASLPSHRKSQSPEAWRRYRYPECHALIYSICNISSSRSSILRSTWWQPLDMRRRGSAWRIKAWQSWLAITPNPIVK